jgi:hypothetical protein
MRHEPIGTLLRAGGRTNEALLGTRITTIADEAAIDEVENAFQLCLSSRSPVSIDAFCMSGVGRKFLCALTFCFQEGESGSSAVTVAALNVSNIRTVENAARKISMVPLRSPRGTVFEWPAEIGRPRGAGAVQDPVRYFLRSVTMLSRRAT